MEEQPVLHCDFNVTEITLHNPDRWRDVHMHYGNSQFVMEV